MLSCERCHATRRKEVIYNGLCHYCNQRNLKIAKWLQGDLSETYVGKGREPREYLKEYLIETRGDACEVCGEEVRRADGTSVIQLNHIDGNYQNNLISNLELLCPNHHATTDTWGGKNKSKGRRKAYRDFLTEF